MALSEATQTLIDKAFTDQEKAAEADALRKAANEEAALARVDAEKADGVALAAHKLALDSANAAIAALMADLGVPPAEGGGRGRRR